MRTAGPSLASTLGIVGDGKNEGEGRKANHHSLKKGELTRIVGEGVVIHHDACQPVPSTRHSARLRCSGSKLMPIRVTVLPLWA
jgi:hypothetical protein